MSVLQCINRGPGAQKENAPESHTVKADACSERRILRYAHPSVFFLQLYIQRQRYHDSLQLSCICNSGRSRDFFLKKNLGAAGRPPFFLSAFFGSLSCFFTSLGRKEGRKAFSWRWLPALPILFI